MNESLEQVETFARELLLPKREKRETEEHFRGRIAKESTKILIDSVCESDIAKERLGSLRKE